MSERELQEQTVYLYADTMEKALRDKFIKVFVVEATIACMDLAVRLLAAMDPETRGKILTVIEEEIRRDVEVRAAMPDARTGVSKLQ